MLSGGTEAKAQGQVSLPQNTLTHGYFAYRCLVKMQKSGKGNCPMCRAPTVLQADRCESHVPWSLFSLSRSAFSKLSGEAEEAGGLSEDARSPSS